MAADPIKLTDMLCEKAEACLRAGEIDRAEALACEVVARDPACVAGHQALARAALARGERKKALELLERRVELPRDDGYGRWGEIAEEAGALDAAVEIYRAHLEQRPDDRDALYRLAMLHADRGERGKAQARLQELVRLQPDFASAAFELARLYEEDGMLGLAAELYDRGLKVEPGNAEARTARDLLAEQMQASARLPDASVEVDGAAGLLLDLFSGREGVYARQWVDAGGRAGYAPVHEPLTVSVLRQHIQGDLTAGVYPLRQDDTVCFLAVDIDIRKPLLKAAAEDAGLADTLREKVWADARRLRAAFEALNLPVYAEESGQKGCHVWLFFSEPMQAARVRRFALALVRRFGPPSPELQWEVFPKQDAVGAGQLGNLIKLPLGVHRKTGRRALFVDPEGAAYADQTAFLKKVRRVDLRAFREAVARLAGRKGEAAPAPLKPEELKAAFPEFQPALEGCAVAGALVEKAFVARHLTHAERHVLKCVFGHFGKRGQEFLHAVISACLDYSRETTQYQIERLYSHPIGCPRIRRHLPELTSSIPCCCEFELPEGGYPSPVLHIEPAFTEGMSRKGGSEGTELVDRYIDLRRRAAEVLAELEQAEAAVRGLLHSRDADRLNAGGWILEEEEGEIRVALKGL